MSAEGTPSETPGHKALTPAERESIQMLRDLGNECRNTLAAIQVLESADARWIAIARTHLQEGLMCAVRAVAKPEFF